MKKRIISAALTLMILCSACGQKADPDTEITNALNMYSGFIYGDETYHDLNANEDYTFEKLGEDIMASGRPGILKAAYVDLDGKNGKELILYLKEGGGVFLILTTIEGKVYGELRGYRCFEELQNDGKYLGSGGAGDSYFRRLSIDKTGVTEETFAEYHDGVFTVGGEVVDGYEEWFEENYSDPAYFMELEH